jgi:pimeloyl-ACP methyl ester carboxylesterase
VTQSRRTPEGTTELPLAPPAAAYESFARRDVLGYSWGVILAPRLAAQHPQVVGRLVLVATSVGRPIRVPGLDRELSARRLRVRIVVLPA